MTNLTAGQIKGLAQAAGFSEAESSVMTAIALAESGGGNPNAHNSVPPDDSYGLWQINMYGSLGPARRQQLGITSNTTLYRPDANAVAARLIYNEQGYKAWSTYGGVRYNFYLPTARNAVANTSTDTQGGVNWNPLNWDWTSNKSLLDMVTGGHAQQSINNAVTGLPDAVNSSIDGLGTIATATVKAGNWLSSASNWLRVGYVVGGGVVLIFALQALFKPVTSQVASGVASAASILPEGKIAKLIPKGR